MVVKALRLVFPEFQMLHFFVRTFSLSMNSLPVRRRFDDSGEKLPETPDPKPEMATRKDSQSDKGRVIDV